MSNGVTGYAVIMKKIKKSEDYYILFFFGVCCYIISIVLVALSVAFFYIDSNNWHIFLVFGSGAYMGGRGCFNIAKERKWEKKK